MGCQWWQTKKKKSFARQNVAQLLITFLKPASANAEENMSSVHADSCHKLHFMQPHFYWNHNLILWKSRGDTWYERGLFWATNWSQTTEKSSCLIPFNAVKMDHTCGIRMVVPQPEPWNQTCLSCFTPSGGSTTDGARNPGIFFWNLYM